MANFELAIDAAAVAKAAAAPSAGPAAPGDEARLLQEQLLQQAADTVPQRTFAEEQVPSPGRSAHVDLDTASEVVLANSFRLEVQN